MSRSTFGVVALLGLIFLCSLGCGGKPQARREQTDSSAPQAGEAGTSEKSKKGDGQAPELPEDPAIPTPAGAPEPPPSVVNPEVEYTPQAVATEPATPEVRKDDQPPRIVRSAPFNPLRAPSGSRVKASPQPVGLAPPRPTQAPTLAEPGVESTPIDPPRDFVPRSFAMSAAEPEPSADAEPLPSEATPFETAPAETAPSETAVPRMFSAEAASTDAATTDAAPADAEPDPPITPESDVYEIVKVFYGTDRRAIDVAQASSIGPWHFFPAACAAALTVCFALLAWRMSSRRLPLAAASAFLLLAAVGLTWQEVATLMRKPADPMREYGNERGELETGVCEVTIPKSHQRGELESPSILRLEVKENASRHIVLQSVVPKQHAEFLAELSAAVAKSSDRDVLIFIHGYNVDFDDAARRTAQLAKDLKLQGAPVLYSWPSQGGLLQYSIDENNVAWTVPHLKKFLLEVVRESDARTVNIIAHSMGNRALASALKELRYELQDDARLFNQVVLAAPDIDADTFRDDIAPAITKTAERVTLYASSKDRALALSMRLHGYPRAGESGPSLLLLEGIDTVDVSDVDLSLLGHSYYGSSSQILTDLGLLIRRGLPAASRADLAANERDGLTYWVFR